MSNGSHWPLVDSIHPNVPSAKPPHPRQQHLHQRRRPQQVGCVKGKNCRWGTICRSASLINLAQAVDYRTSFEKRIKPIFFWIVCFWIGTGMIERVILHVESVVAPTLTPEASITHSLLPKCLYHRPCTVSLGDRKVKCTKPARQKDTATYQGLWRRQERRVPQ